MILQPTDIIQERDVIVFNDGQQDCVDPTMIGQPAELFLSKHILEIRRYTD